MNRSFAKVSYKDVFRTLLFITGILFIILLIVYHWQTLRAQLVTIHWLPFLVSIFIGIGLNFLASLLFRELLQKYEVVAPYQLTHKVFFYAQIAKYIPGKIWSLLYQAMLLQKSGSIPAIIFANFELMMIFILTIATISLSLIGWNYHKWWLGLLFVVGLIFWILLGKFCYLFNLLSRQKVFAERVGKCHELALNVVKLILIYSFFWITYLGSNLLMMSAVFDFSVAQASSYVAYLGLAWIIGVLSFLVPGGIGVKEAFFIMLARYSAHEVSLDLLITIAVISRCWVVLQEITGASLIFLWYFRVSRQ